LPFFFLGGLFFENKKIVVIFFTTRSFSTAQVHCCTLCVFDTQNVLTRAKKGKAFCGSVWFSAFILTFAFFMLTTCSFGVFFFLEPSFSKTKKLLSFFSLHVVFFG